MMRLPSFIYRALLIDLCRFGDDVGFKLILANPLISHYTGIYAKSKVSHFYDFFISTRKLMLMLIESIFVLQKKMSQIIFMSIKHFTISLMMV